MAVALIDVREWSKQGREILASREKLDSKINNKFYSKDFEYVYYAISKSSVDFDAVNRSLTALNQCATGLSSSNHLKATVRQFVASSNEFYKPDNVDEFRRMLKSNGWLPVDPEVEMRRAREEAERVRREREARQRAEQEALRRAEERSRREREARERAERETRERERRKREEAKRKVVRTFFWAAAAAALIYILLVGLPAYKYRYTEYNALMAKAEKCIEGGQYDEAVKAFQDARSRKSSTKKINEIDGRIAEVLQQKQERIKELKQDIETILKTFRTYSFKYGRPENDFNATQQKIDLLRQLSNDADCARFQTQLDNIRKRKI